MEPPSHPDTGEAREGVDPPVVRSEPRAPLLTGVLLFVVVLTLFAALAFARPLFFSTVTPEIHRWVVLGSQIMVILLPSLIVARRQYGRLADGLRLHPVSPGVVVMAAVGIILLSPLTQIILTVQELYLIPEAWIESAVRSRAHIMDSYRNLIVANTSAGIVATYLLAAVVPAACEEILFRGVMQKNFEWRLRPVHAIILASLLFALLHFQAVHFLSLAVIGVYLGFLAWRTGSIIPSMAAHMVFNGIMATALYLVPEATTVRRLATSDLLNALPGGLLSLALFLLIIVWLNRRYTIGNQITLEQ